MHAYLFIGKDSSSENQINLLKKKFNVQVYFFPFQKIEDVRILNNFIQLKVTKPTLIYLSKIDNASLQALNAFLKNLEEPQENLYFFLTAENFYKIPSTIISRCQIIKDTNSSNQIDTPEAEIFFKKSIGEKFSLIDKIKKRDQAVNLVLALIIFFHQKLLQKNSDTIYLSKNLSRSLNCFRNLSANGNIGLQLTNLIINLV